MKQLLPGARSVVEDNVGPTGETKLIRKNNRKEENNIINYY